MYARLTMRTLRPGKSLDDPRRTLHIPSVMANPGFFERLALAFKVLFDAAFAGRVVGLSAGGTTESVEKASKALPEGPKREASALQLLGALQREGRFVDFVQDDVTGVADADIGAAARLVHSGCRKVVQAWFAPTPVRTDEEGSRVTVPAGFNAHEIRLTGRVEGQAPYAGELVHPGWKATRAAIPELTAAAAPEVLAPAEVEI
ncbi:MAG: hypothetical protein ACI9WU_001645 [Myxococcota bacterium]|jgi:hypothetical protein